MSGGEDLAAWLERQGLGAGAEILRAPAALQALGIAGQDAMARAAFVEAAADLERAVEILDELPDADERLKDSFHLRTQLAECYVVIKGHSAPETRRAFENALNVGERVGEPVVLATVLAGLISAAAQRAEYATAQAYADRLLALAQRSGGAFERGWAQFRQGHIHFYLGDLRAARRSLEAALAIGAREPLTIGGARLSGTIMVLLPIAMTLMGDIETGVRVDSLSQLRFHLDKVRLKLRACENCLPSGFTENLTFFDIARVMYASVNAALSDPGRSI